MAIRRVLMNYYRGVDRGDYELVRACFFERADTDYGVFFSGTLDAFMELAALP